MHSSSGFSAVVERSAFHTLVAAGALIAVLWSGAVAAAIELSAHVGFGQVFRLAHWTPVTVTLENRGASVDGVLEVITTAGNALEHRQFDTSTAARVDLPGGARKRLRFAVMLDSLAYPLRVRLLHQGQILAETTVDLRKRFTDRELIAVISSDVGLDYLNSDQRVSTYARAERLPQQWRGYNGVAALVVHGVSLEKLSESQFRALDRWIQQGGRLIVSGRADYGLLRTPRLARLLPTTPDGLRQIPWSAVVGDSGTRGKDRTAHVHRVSGAAQIVYASADVPLVLREPHGSGAVYYLTFDLANAPFNLAAVTAPIWDVVLPPPSGQKPVMDLSQTQREDALTEANRAFQQRTLHPDQRLSDALLRTRAFGFPSLGSVLVLLAFYLGALATLQHLFRERHSRGASFARILTPPAFAALAWYLFAANFPAGPTAIAVASVQPLPNSPLARVDVDLALFSTSRASPQYQLTGADPAWRPVLATLSGYRPPDWTFTRGALIDQQRISVATQQSYVLHVLDGHDLVPFRLSAEATFSADALTLSLHNQSRQTVRGAWLQVGTHAMPVGDLAPDERLERTFPRSARQAAHADASTWQERLAREDMLTPAERVGAGAVLARLGRTESPGVRGALQAGDGRLFGFIPAPVTIQTESGSPSLIVGLFDSRVPLVYTDGGEVDVRRIDPATSGFSR